MGKEELSVIPRVFISYSHDSPSHKEWVLKFASNLMKNGVDVILDRWDLSLGDDMAKFMETSITKSDRVLMICSELYVKKVDSGHGGVGYEAMIVTGELVQNLGSSKFIPVIRQNKNQILLPKFLSTRLYVDLSNDEDFDSQFIFLLKEIHNKKSVDKPILGQNPFINNSFSQIDIEIETSTNQYKDDLGIVGNTQTYSQVESELFESKIVKQLVEVYDVPIDKVRQYFSIAKSLEELADLFGNHNIDFSPSLALSNWEKSPRLVKELNQSRRILKLGPLGF